MAAFLDNPECRLWRAQVGIAVVPNDEPTCQLRLQCRSFEAISDLAESGLLLVAASWLKRWTERTMGYCGL